MTDHRLKTFKATVLFQGYDNEDLRASGLPPLPDRIRECIETHPTASFRIDSVRVEELGPDGNFVEVRTHECSYCEKVHDSRVACPEHAQASRMTLSAIEFREFLASDLVECPRCHLPVHGLEVHVDGDGKEIRHCGCYHVLEARP